MHAGCSSHSDTCASAWLTLESLVLSHRDIAAFQGCAPYLKKCVKELQTSKKCPVCTRDFDSQLDVDKVISMVST